jgi:hypothetical protein
MEHEKGWDELPAARLLIAADPDVEGLLSLTATLR